MIKKFSWPAWLTFILISGVLYGLSWLNISTLTFFSSDTGLRFLQVQSLIDHQWRSFAIEYPAHFLDPEWQYVPYYRAYLIIDDQMYLSLSPIFNFLTSLLYVGLGSYGLPVLPVSGTILSALAIFYLAQLSDLPRPQLLFMATIFMTPMFFYSLELWDHTFATGIALWGVCGLAKGVSQRRAGPLFLGGIALSLGIGQRPELHVLAIATGVSLVWLLKFNWSLLGATLSGGLVGILPVWTVQYIWFGHPLAPVTAQKVFGYGRLETYLYQTRRTLFSAERALLVTTIFAELPSTFLASVLTGVGLFFIILSFKFKGKWRQPLLMSGFITGAIGWLIYLSVVWEGMIVGVLPTFPLIALSVIYISFPSTAPVEKQIIYQFVFRTTFLFLGLAVLLLPSFGGFQWGARYLLVAYPLLLYLAYQSYLVYGPQFGCFWQAISLILVGLTLLLQLFSVRLLYQFHYAQQPMLRAVDAIPVSFTVTDDPFLASHTSATDYRSFLYVYEAADLADILHRLALHDISRVGILLYKEPLLKIPAQVGDVRLRLSGVGESTIKGSPLLIYEFEPTNER